MHAGVEGIRQDLAALFYVALLLTLMPYTYMSMFVADRVFFVEDPLQPLYSTLAYYASVSGINALVSTLNGILLMLIVYGFLGETHVECLTSYLVAVLTPQCLVDIIHILVFTPSSVAELAELNLLCHAQACSQLPEQCW